YLTHCDAQGFSRATRARRLSSIRQFSRFALEEGWRDDDPAIRIAGPGRAKRLPTTLDRAEIDAMLTAAPTLGRTEADKVRNRLMIELLYATGMRVSELVELPVAGCRGDPAVLLFDEPVNGLDPEGIRWFRGLLSQLAAEGRTVLVSSHLMHEIQTVADHVIVIGRGRLLADMSMAELAARYTGGIRVVASDTTPLTAALVSAGAEVRSADGALLVSGLEAAHVGEIALRCGIALRELTPQHTSLEEVFMELTAAATPHRSGSIPASERSQA
ncbi:tyrosine-type recombinase/integrase, partial [Thermobifida sp.]|uniref:tyrosine-type recombinase/integrase n=1 Tax=Thermobifida sp. TaxID=2027107 RepID=UPI00257AA04E